VSSFEKNVSMRQLAEHIAELFSRDARQWPVGRTGAGAMRLAIRFADSAASYVAPLTNSCSEVFSQGYAAEDGERLVLVGPNESADAIVRFCECRHLETHDMGLAYELSFTGSDDSWPGWFALEE
jgi:hypothetical protein